MSATNLATRCYSVVYVVASSKGTMTPPKPGFGVQATSTAVVPDAAGKGSLKLYVTFDKGLKGTHYVDLAVGGADIALAEGPTLLGADGKPAAGGKLEPQKPSVRVGGNGSVTLTLQNLVAGARFNVTATGPDAEGKTQKAKGPAMEINIKRK